MVQLRQEGWDNSLFLLGRWSETDDTTELVFLELVARIDGEERNRVAVLDVLRKADVITRHVTSDEALTVSLLLPLIVELLEGLRSFWVELEETLGTAFGASCGESVHDRGAGIEHHSHYLWWGSNKNVANILLIVDIPKRDATLIIRRQIRKLSSLISIFRCSIIEFEYRFFWWKFDNLGFSSSDFLRSFCYSFLFILFCLLTFSLILDILLIYLCLSTHELVRVTIGISSHIFIDISFIIVIFLLWLLIIVVIILYSQVNSLTKSY